MNNKAAFFKQKQALGEKNLLILWESIIYLSATAEGLRQVLEDAV